ncbi:hypothetical protein [Oscillospiraceae bacterium]|nr:hypothetical protein [Oscillospiraceae bacterium]
MPRAQFAYYSPESPEKQPPLRVSLPKGADFPGILGARDYFAKFFENR